MRSVSRNSLSGNPESQRTDHSLLLLSLFFCVGSMLGLAVFSFFPQLYDVRRIVFFSSAPFLWTLWRFSWPCLLIAFLASSYAGSFVLPFVFAGRGFVLSFCGSVLLNSGRGFSSVLSLVGLSACFSLPAFFLLGETAFRSSHSLFRLYLGDRSLKGSDPSRNRVYFSVLLLFMAAVSRRFFIPLLR